ncbi:MAG: hypothetical protein AB7I38_14480 [Dehalococcoidia bacterium]
MTQPRLAQLHQSGAELGHAVVWDGTTWVAAPAATGMDVVGNFDDYFDLDTGDYDVEFDRADTTSLPPGWSWVNQGASDYREVGGRARLLADGSGGSTSTEECHRMLVRAIPSESSWTAVLKMPSLACFPYDYFRAGLVLRDSSGGGGYTTWGRRVTNNNLLTSMSFDNWSALNTLATNYSTSYMADQQTFLRIKKNSGTSFDFASSADGVAWRGFWGGYDPTADGLTLDQIGIFGSCPSGDYCTVGLDWFRVRT